jgi:flagellar biosynthesis protein FlhB
LSNQNETLYIVICMDNIFMSFNDIRMRRKQPKKFNIHLKFKTQHKKKYKLSWMQMNELLDNRSKKCKTNYKWSKVSMKEWMQSRDVIFLVCIINMSRFQSNWRFRINQFSNLFTKFSFIQFWNSIFNMLGILDRCQVIRNEWISLLIKSL